MKFPYKTLGLLLVSLALAGCGGAGNGHGAFTPPQASTISLSATTTTLPVNTQGYSPLQYGNPTQAEVTVTWRNADGSLVTGRDIAVSISPTNVAAISCLVSANCTDGSKLFGSLPIQGINGQTSFFVNATTVPGTALVVVSGVDPNTGKTVSASLTFTVTSGVGSTPATVTLTPTPAGIYLPGSGGNTNSSINVLVQDGAGQRVPDPVSGNGGFDNVQLSIITPNAGGAILSTNSVSGPVSGTTVTTHTVHGQATVSFQSGTLQGPIQIQATADRSDNNVTNGIADPVSSTTTVVVSDGKLYSLQITSPDVNAININTVSGDVAPPPTSGSTGPSIPPDPNATYSLTVSALGTDRQGNPVIPGTAIRFGSIDEPVGAYGSRASANQFLLSGKDGNPQEGGNQFTAPTGQFQTAGGGAGPGDALIVFGKVSQGAPAGNDDLESALTVQSVTSQTSLNVTAPFNLNDTTGVSVDNGPVLPYIIGRALHGNITTTTPTNSVGVASAKLTYTVSTLGHAVAMWTQGTGIDRVTGGNRWVTDAATLVYPGVAPASLVAFPNPIPGDTTTSVTVCVTDALHAPIQGVPIGFQFNLSGGTGSVDGTTGSGALTNRTGADGCAIATVVTSGVPATATAGANSGTLSFSAAGQTTSVNIVVALAFLSASPPQICTNPAAAGSRSLTIGAVTTGGAPAPGVVINGTCTSGVILTPASATTGSNGSATFQVNWTAPPSPGTCTFTASGGTQSVTVPFGQPSAFSPPCS